MTDRVQDHHKRTDNFMSILKGEYYEGAFVLLGFISGIISKQLIPTLDV